MVDIPGMGLETETCLEKCQERIKLEDTCHITSMDDHQGWSWRNPFYHQLVGMIVMMRKEAADRSGTRADLVRGSEYVTLNHAILQYWLFWIKGTWETASSRRALWSSFISPKEGVTLPHERYQEGRRHPYHQREEIQGQGLCVCVCAQPCLTLLRPHRLYPARLLCSWNVSRKEHWSKLPFPPPEDLPHWGTEPVSFTSLALAGRFFTTSVT